MFALKDPEDEPNPTSEHQASGASAENDTPPRDNAARPHVTLFPVKEYSTSPGAKSHVSAEMF